jgi:hypothetical protein
MTKYTELTEINKRILYVFLDEGGNLDFSHKGTKYFTLTALAKERPFEAYKQLCELKYDLVESAVNLEYFHASEDRQDVRNQVFTIINNFLDKTRIDALVIEKRKTGPALRPEDKFYPEMLGYLLSYVVRNCTPELFNKVIVFTDSLPVKNKRRVVEKVIKNVLAHKFPNEISYCIFHHSSKSNIDLQIVDYCNWAIYRKWENNDLRSYDLIRRSIKSEFDIFQTGTTFYY